MLDISIKPEPVWEFEAEVQVLHHATTITPGIDSCLFRLPSYAPLRCHPSSS